MRSDHDKNRNDTNRNDMNRDDRNDANRHEAGGSDGRSTSGAQREDERYVGARQEGDRYGTGRHDGGRHDGGRYDTGRFGDDFYEGGRDVGGMGGRYEAERYSGYGGSYGARGGYGAGGGYGMQGGYGQGMQGGYGGQAGWSGDQDRYGGDFRGGYGMYGGDGGGRADPFGPMGRHEHHGRGEHHDRDGGGGMPWMIAAGAALAAVGGYALYRTTMGTRHDRQGRSRWRGIHVEESVTIQKPASEIYEIWHDLENLGDILSHVEKVETLGEGRSRWTAKGPANTKVTWEAETVQDIENERITWRSVPGSDVPNEGSVWFQERSGGRGTEVHVSLMYHPPGGALAAGLAGLFGEEPHQQISDDLRRFKSRMEAGETIGSAHAKPSGRTGSSDDA